MDESSVHNPLLWGQGSGHANVRRKTSLSVTLAKWILKIAMLALFISWIALMFLFPADFVQKLFEKWIQATDGTVFGITGEINYCLCSFSRKCSLLRGL